MPNLLTIVASPRGDYSISRALAAQFVETWKQNHTDGTVKTRDLFTTNLPFIDLPWIAGAYSPVEEHAANEALAISNELVAELQAADHILIATPMYNFSTPAILKAWIDHVVRVNVTFSQSYEGLLKNKKVTVIVASAGVYTPGSHTESYNKETAYLQFILGFIGLTDVTFVLAGGSSGVDMGKINREDFLAQHVPEVIAAAA